MKQVFYDILTVRHGGIIMVKRPENMHEVIEELRHVRDELNVQIHLAAAEVRDEWEDLEKKWGHFRARAEQVGETTGEAAEDVGEALELVGEELRKGYRRIRKKL
jgi:hypothetical protein